MRDKRPRTPMALSLTILVALCPAAKAQTSEHAKILDVQTSTYVGTPTVVEAGGVPVVIPNSGNLFTLTVQMDDIVYSAQFGNSRKLHSRDFIVGDTAKVTIQKDRMVVMSPSGKEVKGRLIRLQRVAANPKV